MRSLPEIYRKYVAENMVPAYCECPAFSFPHVPYSGDCQGTVCNRAEFEQEEEHAQA